MQQQSADSVEVKQALHRIFARPEFEKDERTLFDDFLEWLLETTDVEGSTGALDDIVDLLVNVLVAFLAVFLIWLAFRLVREYMRSLAHKKSVALQPALLTQTRVRELYAAAREARQAGNRKLAIQLGLFALVTGLGARGAFEYRDAWTYREILRNGRPEQTAYVLLNGLVTELEAKEFGAEPISEADLDQLENLCDEHLAAFLEVAA